VCVCVAKREKSTSQNLLSFKLCRTEILFSYRLVSSTITYFTQTSFWHKTYVM